MTSPICNRNPKKPAHTAVYEEAAAAVSWPMPDDLAPPPKPRQRGNSREYIIDRLRREGLDDWAAAVETGEISAFALACELGWTRRPPTLLGEDTNQAKRRRYVLAQLRD